MITIGFPHMGLNDVDSPVWVQMWNTRRVARNETRQKIVEDVAAVARGAPGGKLNELVIACHGAPGYLHLGEGVRSADVSVFEAWRGLVNKVWIRACLVGRIVTPDSAREGDGALISALSLSGDGHAFCKALARALQCYLVVGTETQASRYTQSKPVPYGQLDSYEGLVLSYHGDGEIHWMRRYRSVSGIDPTSLTGRSPNWE